MAAFVLIALAGCARPPAPEVVAPPGEGARLSADVYLSARGPDLPEARFDFPTIGGRETVITLASTEPRAMPAALSCEGPARLRLAGSVDPGLFLRPGARRAFALPSRHEGTRPQIVLPPGTDRCTLDWAEGNRLTLMRESLGDPSVARLDDRRPRCSIAPAGSDPLARAFFAARDLSQSCAQPTGAFALYPDETEALRLRLEKLTGARISRAALLAGDPDMALDFTNAPRFDQIVVSYLHVRADLAGYLAMRALAFHAARGTKIRIALSGRLALPVDRRLIEGLAAQYPNVQVQKVFWRPEIPSVRGVATGIVRSHHVKLFAGLSPDPGASFALVGGRNLHDGFFFPDLENRPKRPFLHDYDRPTLNPLAYVAGYEDFEIALFDRETVAAVVSHFGKFWNRDTPTQTMPPATAAEPGPASARRDGLVRHYISLPWVDGAGQERFFIDLIDAAQSEIIAIAPFIYPTDALDEALLRAADRGVKVTLVARIGYGEPVQPVVNAGNTRYAALRGDRFRVLHYEPEGRLMHTKIMVIDERLGVVMSSNLNPRSFLQDTENGLVFLDREVSKRLKAVVERAAARGGPMVLEPNRLWLGETLYHFPGIWALL